MLEYIELVVIDGPYTSVFACLPTFTFAGVDLGVSDPLDFRTELPVMLSLVSQALRDVFKTSFMQEWINPREFSELTHNCLQSKLSSTAWLTHFNVVKIINQENYPFTISNIRTTKPPNFKTIQILNI